MPRVETQGSQNKIKNNLSKEIKARNVLGRPLCCDHCPHHYAKAQVTLCRSFFADVPDHSRPSRSVMIVTKPSDRGHNSRSLSAQDCLYDLSTITVRHWYDGSV